jgi:hypothetical protein
MPAGSLLVLEYISAVSVISAVETIDGLSFVDRVIVVMSIGEADHNQLLRLFEIGSELFGKEGRLLGVADSDSYQGSENEHFH